MPRPGKMYEHQGESLNIRQWADRYKLPVEFVRRCIKRKGWSLKKTLSATPRPSQRKLTYKGETLPVQEWSKRTGIKPATIHYRLASGRTVEETLAAPVSSKRFLQRFGKQNKRSGRAAHALSSTWYNMLSRCYDQDCNHYHNYGGRGISVHKEWYDFWVYAKYIESTLGPKPSSSHTLDRINNSDGYKPGNMRWANKTQQGRNQRRNTNLTFNGETKTITEWAEVMNMPYSALQARTFRGWSAERALTTPVQERGRAFTLTFNKVTKTWDEWASELGITRQGLRARLKNGWSLEKALTTPKHLS